MSEKRYVISELDPISVLDMNTGDTFPIADGSGFVEIIVECLNTLHEENIVLKQEVELLRNGLEAYEDNLPLYLTPMEIRDFNSDIYDFKKKQQNFYNEHPNRCKIIVNGVELK